MRWKVYQRPTVFDNHRHYFITRNRCHGGKLAARRHFQSYLSSVFVPADWMSLSSPRHLNWKRSWVWVISLKIHRYMIHDDIWWSAGISSWPVKNRVTHFLISCSVRRFVRKCIWFRRILISQRGTIWPAWHGKIFWWGVGFITKLKAHNLQSACHTQWDRVDKLSHKCSLSECPRCC